MTNKRRIAASVLGAAVGLPASQWAQGAITGFGTFAPVNTNLASTGNLSNASGTIGYSGSTFTLTNSVNDEATSGYSTAAQNVSRGFTAQFTYTSTPQLYNGGPDVVAADGLAFVIQNDARATASLGGRGGSRGYGAGGGGAGDTNAAVTPSAAVEFGTFGSATHYPGAYGFNTNGTTNTPYGFSGTGVTLVDAAAPHAAHPINVKLSYVASSGYLQETFTDTVTNKSTSHIDTGVNLASTLGAASGLVGFSAGTGGFNSTQQVSNFSFVTDQATVTGTKYAPINIAAGYNRAIIVPAVANGQSGPDIFSNYLTGTQDKGAAASGTNTGNTWFENGFTGNSASVNNNGTSFNASAGLPKLGTTFTSQADAFHSFQLHAAQFDQFGLPITGEGDVAQLDTTSRSATLNFTTPTAYTGLSLLSAASNAGSEVVDVSVTYLNGPIVDLGNISAVDWYASTQAAAAAGAVYDVANNRFDFTNAPKPGLFQTDVPLTDTTDPISSVTVTYNGTSTAFEYSLFAISGGTPFTSSVSPVPEPTTAGLLAVAGGALAARRRRRQPGR